MTYNINTQVLDRLVETFPIGQVVENFGLRAKVSGYHWSETLGYTGSIILTDVHDGSRWVADPDKCVRVSHKAGKPVRKSAPVSISYVSVDECLWQIKARLMGKYGCDQADNDIAPLSWYVSTGRASCEFLRLLVSAKPFMVARKLHDGGTYSEALDRIKQYIGY